MPNNLIVLICAGEELLSLESVRKSLTKDVCMLQDAKYATKNAAYHIELVC